MDGRDSDFSGGAKELSEVSEFMADRHSPSGYFNHPCWRFPAPEGEEHFPERPTLYDSFRSAQECPKRAILK
jgi:hypothetical protein